MVPTYSSEFCSLPTSSLPQTTAHVLAAAQGGFDLAMAVGALGDLNLCSVIQLQHVVFKGRTAFGTGGVDRHATF